jgi:acyl-CoA thioester hydrolase
VIEEVSGGASFEYLRKVRFSDTDCTGRIFFPRYVEWVDEAVTEYFVSKGILFDERGGLIVNGSPVDWTVVTGEYWCRMLKPLKMSDLLTIRVWVERIGNSSMTFGGEVLKEGEVVALARITYVCVSTSNLRPVPLPDVLKGVLAAILREGERQAQSLSQGFAEGSWG